MFSGDPHPPIHQLLSDNTLKGARKSLWPDTTPVMEAVNQQLGAWSTHRKNSAPIECLAFEILEHIFSYLPRKDRLTTSRCSKVMKKHNEKFTWTSLHIETGDPPNFTHRTERSKYLFENLRCLQHRLLECKYQGGYTEKLSLKMSRCHTYDILSQTKSLKRFSSLQELSLSPPPFDFELLVEPPSLRLDFYYDRTTFWNQYYAETPRLNLEPYFQMPNLRKLQIEHISFEDQMHYRSFPVQRNPSPIEDLRFIDCSPQTTGILTRMLLSVKCLKRLALELNIPWPIVKSFGSNGNPSDWARPGGQDYGMAIRHHEKSLEELVIAFSDGASFFIRPSPAARLYAPRIPRTALVPPIGSFDTFKNLERLAIPIQLLPRRKSDHALYDHMLLPKSLEVLQLQITFGNSLHPREGWTVGERQLMLALANETNTCLPRLVSVVLWFQPYSFSEGETLSDIAGAEDWWNTLKEGFNASGVDLEQVWSPFFEDTPFGQSLNILHSRLRPPDLVQQGPFIRDRQRPGLYYDSSTNSVF